MRAEQTTTGWEAGLDLALVARLARPLRRPGLLSLAIVRQIHGAVAALLGRLPLLERFSHKVRALAAPETPIVHARSGGAGRWSAPAARSAVTDAKPKAPPPPVVRGVERTLERAIERTSERTLVIETTATPPLGGPIEPPRASRERAGNDVPLVEPRPASAPRRVDAPGTRALASAPEPLEHTQPRERIERTEVHERIERRERIASNASSATTPSRGTSTSPAAAEPIEQPAPPTRRSRLGAPIARREAEPRGPTELVGHVAPSPLARTGTGAGVPAGPAASSASAAPRPLVARAVATAVAAAPEGRTPHVVSPRPLRAPSLPSSAPSARTVGSSEVPVVRRAATASGAAPSVGDAAPRVVDTPSVGTARALAEAAAIPVVSPSARLVQGAHAPPPALAQAAHAPPPALAQAAYAPLPALAPSLPHAAPRVQVPPAGAERTPPRGVPPAPPPAPASAAHRAPAAPPPPPPKLDLHELADHVQHILARRALQERERRGLPR